MRRTPLRLLPPLDRTGEPGYREWHAPVWGRCAVCGTPGRLERHHVVLEQHVRQVALERAWDLSNALELGVHCRCHRQHHAAAQRIAITKVPDAAIAFCSELYGPAAGAYLSRYYAPG